MIKALPKSRKTLAFQAPTKSFRTAMNARPLSAATSVAFARAPVADVSPLQSLWQIPTADVSLEINETHIWAARLDAENSFQLERLLSGDELARAGRFRFNVHRRQYVAARGILRVLLGSYLRVEPHKIRFDYGEFGKPQIAGREEIKFNLSHAGDLAIYAVARNREIGVDVEEIKPAVVDRTMLDQILTEQEKTFYYALGVEKRDSFFFECWTRKEAYLKARGLGLMLPPNEVETLSYTNSSFKLAAGFRPAGWSIQNIPFMPDNMRAALAIESEMSPRLRFWQRPNANFP